MVFFSSILLAVVLVQVRSQDCPPGNVINTRDDPELIIITSGDPDKDITPILNEDNLVVFSPGTGFEVTGALDATLLITGIQVDGFLFNNIILELINSGGETAFSDDTTCEGDETFDFIPCVFPIPAGGLTDIVRIRLTVMADGLETGMQNLIISACVEPNWCDWSPCTITCGDPGTRTRVCDCPNPDPDQYECFPDTSAEGDCPAVPCCPEPPSWGPWGDFGDCSATCGEGTKIRERDCLPNGDCPDCTDPDDCECEGDDTDSEDCSTPLLPPSWGQWGEYGPCSVSCGEGTMTRTRECLPDPDCPDCTGSDCVCDGEDTDSDDCSTELTPASWGPWGDFGSCSVTCGDGRKTRRRECLPDGECPDCTGDDCECDGSNKDRMDCSIPFDEAEWGPWGPWGECNTDCGEGTKRRTRKCMPAGDCPDCTSPADCECDGSNRDTMDCFVPGNDPYWGPWGPWGECETKCGLGLQHRDRECEIPFCPTSDECPGGDDAAEGSQECEVPIILIDFSNHEDWGVIKIKKMFQGDPADVLSGSPAAYAFLVDNDDGKDRVTFKFNSPVTVYKVQIETKFASQVKLTYKKGLGSDKNNIEKMDQYGFTPSEFEECKENVESLQIDFIMPWREMAARNLKIWICVRD